MRSGEVQRDSHCGFLRLPNLSNEPPVWYEGLQKGEIKMYHIIIADDLTFTLKVDQNENW